jgi:hypothetical protein
MLKFDPELLKTEDFDYIIKQMFIYLHIEYNERNKQYIKNVLRTYSGESHDGVQSA